MSVGRVSFAGDFLQVPLSLARAGVVNVRLYSVLGNEVVNVNRVMNTGAGSILISKENVPSGVYMMSVQIGSSHVTKRIDLK